MALLTKEHVRESYPLLILLVIFTIIFSVWQLIPEEDIRAFIDRAGIFAPLAWMAASLVTYIVAPLSGTPLLFVGYYAFGKMVIVYSILVGMVGAMANFYIARHYGRRIVVKLIGKEPLRKVDHITEHYGMETVFFLRVFLASLHDAVSYAAGLTAISFTKYMAATLLAFIPSGIIWYIVSLSSDNPTVFTGMTVGVSFVMAGLFYVGLWIHKRLQKAK